MQDSHSILSLDGSIVLSRDIVTWPLLLQLGRLTNSKKGGWNSRSFWASRGLSNFKDRPDWIEAVTRNSLDERAEPLARTKSFMIKERHAAEKRGKNEPTNENALNWNLAQRLRFSAEQAKNAFTFSYEVPLAATKVGQLKVDAMVFHSAGRIEIIELKRDRGADSPLMALIETICYALQTLRCQRELLAEVRSASGVDVGGIRNIHLVIAAPNYWDHCNGKGKSITTEQEGELSQLVSRVARAAGVAIGLTFSGYDKSAETEPFSPRGKVPAWSVLNKPLTAIH